MTIVQVAERAGVSPAQVYNIESGRTQHPRQATMRVLRETLVNHELPGCSFCGCPSREAGKMARSEFNPDLLICGACAHSARLTLAAPEPPSRGHLRAVSPPED